MPEKARLQTAKGRSAKRRLPSFRSRNRRDRIPSARESDSDPNPGACSGGSPAYHLCDELGRLPESLFPFQGPFFDDVEVPDEENRDEYDHFDEAEPAKLSKRHRPRIEEDCFDVENDEKHRDEIEFDWKTDPGGRLGDNTAFVRHHSA